MAVLTGTAGNDTYSGSLDVVDTAVIDALQRQARLRFDGVNWRSTSSVTGDDLLVSIESIRFRDATLALSGPGGGRVNVSSVARPSDTAVAILADGRSVIAYVNNGADSSGFGVFARFVGADGVPIGPELAINTTTSGSQYAPSVTALANGGFAVSYTSENDILIQRFTADGQKEGSETIAHTATDGYRLSSSITGLADGGFVVDWLQQGTGTSGAFLRKFDAGGTAVTDDIAVVGALSASAGPELAALAGGRFVAIWTAGGRISSQLYNADATAVGSEPIIVSDLLTSAFDPQVVAIGNGYAVAWTAYGVTGAGNDIAAQLFTATGAAASPLLLVNTSIDGNQDQPAIAVLADGGFAVAWRSQFTLENGSVVSQLVTQRFDARGSKVGGELPVATYFGGFVDFSPVVTADATGDFAVSYYDFNGIASAAYDSDGLALLARVTGDAKANVIDVSGGGAVRVDGGEGDDVLTASSSGDVLVGGAGADLLTGGLGDDLYVADDEDRIVEQQTGGVDTVQVDDDYVLTDQWIENLWLVGSADAAMIGNALANTLIGNGGDNLLNGGEGADRLEGGRGDDTYVVDQLGDVVVELAGAGIDTVVSSVAYTLAAQAENLRLTGVSAIAGTGNALDNQIIGNAAANLLDGGAGRDLLAGGLGDDTYVVDVGDQIVEVSGEGYDRVVASASWTLGAHLEALTLSGTAVDGTGNDLDNLLIGNERDNVLDGGAGGDVMDGGAGSDTYLVDDERDIVAESALSVRDRVVAYVSHALGANIEELLLAGAAAIDGTGNTLNNAITGNAGANRLDGGAGADVLAGGLGNDVLRSADGLDRLLGGAGDDQFFVTANDDVVERFGQGIDTVTVSVARAYALTRQIENLVLLGGDVDGYGNALANAITGTLGANLIDGGKGADTMAGLSGNDFYVVNDAGDRVVEEAGGGLDEVLSAVTFSLAANVENLTLTGLRKINGVGNELDNRLVGNSAVNSLRGGAGNDTLVGAGGADTLMGEGGDDLMVGSSAADTFNGAAGVDTASYFALDGAVTVSLARTGAQNTGAGGKDTLIQVENLEGSNTGNDALTGSTAANRLVGNGGDDALSGGAGNDVLLGGDGADTILGEAGDDTVDGGAGVDLLSFSAAKVAITVDLDQVGAQATGLGSDVIRNIERVEGSNVGGDRIMGDFRDNALYGLGGNDTLAGGDGSDLLDGGAGTDTVDYARAGTGVSVTLVLGGALDDGSGASDTLVAIENLVGSAFDDELAGAAGRNVLTGSGGRDLLTGGAGGDIFVYLAVTDSTVAARARDVIVDFTSNLDKIDLAAIDADTATTANDAFAALIGADQAFTAAGQLRLVDGVLYGNVDSDAQAEFAIDLSGLTAIALTDLVL